MGRIGCRRGIRLLLAVLLLAGGVNAGAGGSPAGTQASDLQPALLGAARKPAAEQRGAADRSAAAGARKSDHPPIIESMQRQGLKVVRRFDAPSGLRGYAGLAGGQPLAVYATADGKHALVGMLIDMKGEDIGAEPLRRLVAEPMSRRIWSQLEDSHWIADGKPDAPRIVYTFSDPNCPYCNRFWKAARPWIESGKVQLRHVVVGVIRADSPAKAAAMFGAASPSKALESNERTFASGGIKPAATVSDEVRAWLDANEQLMTALGIQGTPGILFRDESGIVQTRAGLPSADDLVLMFGPR